MPFTLRHARLDVGADEQARLAALLDPEEQARAARFRFAEGRRRFEVRRGRLREWLGEAAGAAPEALRFTLGPRGKPALAGGPCFSASHSGEVMLVAFSDAGIGCDIERIDEALDWRPLAERFCSPAEKAALAEADNARAFFDCWSRKEAYVKALGEGLFLALDGFTVSVGREAALLEGEAGWAIADAGDVVPGYAAAVVWRQRRSI